MRIPLPPVIAGVLVACLGAAGLVRGAVAQAPAADAQTSPNGTIAVTDAYVRAPVPPSRTAAAYFTVYNTGGTDDRLLDVQTGAGASAVLHTVNADGSMSAAADGVVIRAHGRFVLATGRGHVMIQHVYGRLAPGQYVNLELDFQKAGPIDVVAPVIAVGAPAPGEAQR